MKDSTSFLKVASPPHAKNEQDVEILNERTNTWEFYTLRKRIDRTPSDPYVVTWQKVGTLDGYSRDELNDLYKAKRLRLVDPSEYMESTPREKALKRVETKKRHKSRYWRQRDDLDEMIELDRELAEESGQNDRIRKELAGFTDYRLTFEFDDMEPGTPFFKLVFFAGSAFAGSCPYYLSENRNSARMAAGQIAFCSGVPMSGRLGRDATIGAGTCLGTIEARKASQKELDGFVRFVREMTGFTGTITIDDLGSSAEREISMRFGVRDTPRRSAA